jgi:hypothetical protein
MAINYDAGKLPKGASNSNSLAQTPGTQLTAMQNVNTGMNINPNMPPGPQLNKQAKSSFQQSLMKAPAPKKPSAPAQPRTPVVQDRVIARGQAMAPGRGYNIFSGMDANQISQMNQTMGLSNMSALPSVVKDAGTGMNLMPRGQQQQFLMSSEPTTGASILEEQQAQKESEAAKKKTSHTEQNPYTGSTNTISVDSEGTVTFTDQDGNLLEEYEGGTEEANAAIATYELEKPTQEEEMLELGYVPIDGGKTAAEALAITEAETLGIDPEKKQQMFDMLDQEYAVKLDQALAGLDRQAAMMGTFGSGAHMMNVNNALAQVLANMADEYNEINKLDVQVQETDFQQLFANQLAAAGFSEQEAANAMNMLNQIDSSLVTSMGDYITQYAPNEEIAAELTGQLGSTVAKSYQKVLDGTMTEAEYTAELEIQFALARATIMAANGNVEEAKSFLEQSFIDVANPFSDLDGGQEYIQGILGTLLGGPVIGAVYGVNMLYDLAEDAWSAVFG